jgi:hypothetical protein
VLTSIRWRLSGEATCLMAFVGVKWTARSDALKTSDD